MIYGRTLCMLCEGRCVEREQTCFDLLVAFALEVRSSRPTCLDTPLRLFCNVNFLSKRIIRYGGNCWREYLVDKRVCFRPLCIIRPRIFEVI